MHEGRAYGGTTYVGLDVHKPASRRRGATIAAVVAEGGRGGEDPPNRGFREATPRYGSSEAEIAERARAIPLGRIARLDDIARAAVFLASGNAGLVTGQTLHVNGGSYLA
jgi:NAD(P)-dependent dehydrogenase (short-subunit alcohol dehydrogenase family)